MSVNGFHRSLHHSHRDTPMYSLYGFVGSDAPPPFCVGVRPGLRFRVCWRSARRHAGHAGVDEGEVPEHGLVHAVDERAVGAGKPRLLVDELFVEVAAVAGRRLRTDKGGALFYIYQKNAKQFVDYFPTQMSLRRFGLWFALVRLCWHMDVFIACVSRPSLHNAARSRRNGSGFQNKNLLSTL